MILNWELYDPTRHGGYNGVYLFLLPGFGYAPFYVGKANRFWVRFVYSTESHELGFRQGLRTFLLKPFFATFQTHGAFARQWHWARKEPSSADYIFVALDEPSRDAKGHEFWLSLTKIVCPLEKDVDLQAIEARVQLDVITYYRQWVEKKEEDWSVPGFPRSGLFGHRTGPHNPAPRVQHSFNRSLPTGPDDFFQALPAKLMNTLNNHAEWFAAGLQRLVADAREAGVPDEALIDRLIDAADGLTLIRRAHHCPTVHR
jgi:hypothetical protein